MRLLLLKSTGGYVFFSIHICISYYAVNIKTVKNMLCTDSNTDAEPVSAATFLFIERLGKLKNDYQCLFLI